MNAPGHVICVERRRELAAVDAVVAAIVELGELRKSASHLIFEGEVVTPASLRNYLTRHVIFSRNGKPIDPPWAIATTIIERARGNEVPVANVDAGGPS
jgi:hypothetical protein